jgi:outer membrane usher protein
LKIINFLIKTILIVFVSFFISYLIFPHVDGYFKEITSEIKELEKKPAEATQVNKGAVEEKKENILDQNLEKKVDNIEAPATVAKKPKSTSLGEDNCSNDSEILLVDLTLNLMSIPEPVRVEKLPNGGFVLPESLLKELNIIPNTQKVKTSDCLYGYLIDSNSGFKLNYNPEKFSLDINAPYEVFALNVFDQKIRNKVIPEPPLTGAYVDYQIYGTQVTSKTLDETKNSNSAAGLLSPTIFSKFGSITNSFALSHTQQDSTITRADSFFQKDYPESMKRLIIGDTSSSDGKWSRSAHYLGLRLAKNYSLDPSYIYVPNTILSGSAAIPSVVDVYINNQKTFSQKITPGPFDFSHLPLPEGSGQVKLIVKDLLGNEQIISKELYQASTLLAQGENDFSLESGFLRKSFGEDSSRYSDPFASTSYMYGVTNSTTAQGRFEVQQQRQALGGNVSTTMGNFALLNLVGAFSNDDESGLGNQYGIGLQQQNSSFGSNFSLNRYDNNFRQFASVVNEIRPKMRIGSGINLPIKFAETFLSPEIKTGVSMNYIQSSSWDDTHFKSISLSSGFPLPFGASISIFGNKRLDDEKAWSMGMSIGYSYDQYSSRISTSKDTSGVVTTNTSINSPTPSGSGIGWGVSNEDFKNNLKFNSMMNTSSAQITTELSKKDNLIDGKRIGVSGSIGFLEKEIFASRTINDSSFAVVKVGTFPDLPVYNQNNVAGLSNKSGVIAFPIRSYEKSKIEIKEEDLPFELESKIVEFNNAAYARSGIFINFPVKYSKNLLIHIKQPNGSNIPAGAYARVVSGTEEYIVAKDGQVYLTSLSEKNRVIVTWLEYKCEFDLEVDMKNTDQEIVEPFICK